MIHFSCTSTSNWLKWLLLILLQLTCTMVGYPQAFIKMTDHMFRFQLETKLGKNRSAEQIITFDQLERPYFTTVNIRWDSEHMPITAFSYTYLGKEYILNLVEDPHVDSYVNLHSSRLYILPKEINSITLPGNATTAGYSFWIDIYSPPRVEGKKFGDINTRHKRIQECDFEYITRKEWGCPDGSNSRNPTFTQPTHLIVHHSFTPLFLPNEAMVLSIWNYHVNSNGWSDIGYNWLITPDGTIFEGRGSNENRSKYVLGAHFCSKNSNTIGVCLIGDFTAEPPAPLAMQSLIKVLSYHAFNLGFTAFDPVLHSSSGLYLNRISPHKAGCNTECPGNAFGNLDVLTQKVKEYLNTSCYLMTSTNVSKADPPLSIYPNPAQYQITLKSDKSLHGTLKIYTIHGKEMDSQEIQGIDARVNISGLPPGLYSLVYLRMNHLSGRPTLLIKI